MSEFSFWRDHEGGPLSIGPPKRELQDDDDNPESEEEESSEFQPERTQLDPRALNDIVGGKNTAYALIKFGACVIKDPWFTSHVPWLVEQFDKTLREFPEYLPNRRDKETYVMGGFSALGNASSFHNPFVRFLRLHAMRAVYPTFKTVTARLDEPGATPLLLSEIIDRMLYRPAGVKPSKDTWHRDIKPQQDDDETIYGGWINTSNENQYLSCVLMTHTDEPNPRDPKGFAKITDKRLIAQYETDKTKIEVPPGAILIFNERMVHEVLADVKPYPVRRVFLAWMTTSRRGEHFPPQVDEDLRDQAVVQIKSGQIPTLFSKMHTVFHLKKLAKWAEETFVLQMLHEETQGPDAKQMPNETFKLPYMVAYSLRVLRLPLYEAYKPHEVAILYANDNHVLPVTVGSDQLAPLNLRTIT